MKVGFTGTRKGMTDEQKRSVQFVLQNRQPNDQIPDEFHHGDCLGADAEAHDIAYKLAIPIVIHPPIEKKERAFCPNAYQVLRPKPYLDRNHDIVDAVELLIATPKEMDEVLRSGTWATVRYARLKGVDICMVYPDGVVGLQ